MSLECIPLLRMTGSEGQLQSSLCKTNYNIHARIIIKGIFLSGFIKMFSVLCFYADKFGRKASEKEASAFTSAHPLAPNPPKGKNGIKKTLELKAQNCQANESSYSWGVLGYSDSFGRTFKNGTYMTYTAKLALKLEFRVNWYFPPNSEGTSTPFPPL